MKKVLSFVIAVVMVASLAASAFATSSPSLSPTVPSPSATPSTTPSPVNGGSPDTGLLVPEVVGVVAYDANGNVVEVSGKESIVITNEAVKDSADSEAAAALDAAVASLKEAGTVDAVVPARAGMVVCDVFHIGGSDELATFLANGGSVTVTLDMQMEAGTEMDAIVYKDGVWALQDETWDTAVTVEDNGDVNLTINQLGIFALLSK